MGKSISNMKIYQFENKDRIYYMDVKIASEYLHFAKSTIYKWVEENYIPHKKLGKRVLFIKDDIDQWVQNNGMIVKDLPEVPKSILKGKDAPEVKHINVSQKERTKNRHHTIVRYRPAV